MRAARGRSRQFPGARDLLLFGEALSMLGAASVAIALLPFRVIARTASIGSSYASASEREQDKLADDVVRAVLRASRRVPWRSVCFHEGLAVHWMLRRRGVRTRLHYGLSRVEEFGAHVWVSVKERILVGGTQEPNFRCVAIFPAGEE